MNLESVFRRLSRKYLTAASTQSNRSHSPRLAVETLEAREVPAVLPAPVVDYTTTRSISDNTQSPAIAPAIAQDPLNANQLFGAHVVQNGAETNINVIYSNNGGSSWQNLGFFLNGADPLPSTDSGIVRYTNVSNPSVTFDRFHNAYLTYIERNADSSTGQVILRKFSFNGAPSAVDINIRNTPTNAATIYQWQGTDRAFNPNVAVDSNQGSFTDTGETQTDGLAGTQTAANRVKVFVSWNTSDVAPDGASNFNPNVIRMAVSENGGSQFAPSVMVNNFRGAGDSSQFTMPKVVFTPGRANQASSGGKMVTTYATFSSVAGNTALVADTITYTGATAPRTVAGISTTTRIIQEAIQPASGDHIPVNTDYTVNIPAGSSITSLGGLSVRIALQHNDLSQVGIRLIDPSGTRSVQLFFTGTDQAGNATNIGIAGTELGLQDHTYTPGTIFTDDAVRDIRDATAASPYIGAFNPNGGSLNATFGGMTAAEIAGNWTIRITDFRFTDQSGTAPQDLPQIQEAEIRISQNFDDGLGADNSTGSFVNRNNPTGTAHPTANPANPAGIGAGISLAVDNSLGAFSPYQNRLYAAYVSGGNVFVTYSDNGGVNWTSRPSNLGAGFNPSVTVDPLTGTVLVSYYSLGSDPLTVDPAGTRVQTMLATSVSGPAYYLSTPARPRPNGQIEFSKGAPVNPFDTAYDQIRSKTLQTEYVPSNGAQIGVEGFGNNMGLVSYGGNVNLLYTGNLNRNIAQIRTQKLKISAGPRIVAADTGAILGTATVDDTKNGGTISYNQPAGNGQAAFDGFFVEFDRVVDPTTFTPADIKIIYRSPTADAQSDGAQITPTSVTAIDEFTDPVDGTSYGSKRFFVRVPAQTNPGTYSYVVGNLNGYEAGRFGTTDANSVSDRIRGTKYSLVNQPIVAGDTYDFANFGSPFETLPTPITDRLGDLITDTSSNIFVPTPAGSPTPVIASVSVKVNITHPNVGELSISLTSPDGVVIPLMRVGDAKPDTSVTPAIDPADLTNTVFSDTGATTLANTTDTAPYTGTYIPAIPLSNLFGGTIAGAWTLTVTDTIAGNEGTLDAWEMTIQRAVQVVNTSAGNKMDQNGNGLENEANADVFSVPTAKNNKPFILPYVPDAFPISVPGPHVVGTKPVGAPASSDNLSNLVVNSTVTGLDIQFDRTMNTATFTTADILRITGPRGDLSLSGLTITPITALGGSVTTGNSRFYRISIPVQKLAGSYQIQLGSNIADTNGTKIDKDTNAGVKVLLGQVDPTTAVSTISYGGATSVGIPARGSATATVNINGANDGYLLQKLTANLTLNVPGGQLRDLEARLVSPDGTVVVPLFINSPTTGSSSSATNVTFTDDSTATPVQNGFATNGFNNPIQPLAQFNNVLARGVWSLVIKNKGAVSASLSSFSLGLGKPQLTSGVGDVVADQTSLQVKLFQADGSSDAGKQNWNPAGPDGNTTYDAANVLNGNPVITKQLTTVGRVSNVQVDPTDPSGNIVYASGASGGVWRTTNFLTRNPQGPNWVPLTDFGTNQVLRDANGNIVRSGGSINVGSIALFNETGDPANTKVLVGTGSDALNVIDGGEDGNRYDGVGFLYSEDAGKTWQILDSRVNFAVPTGGTTAGYLPLNDIQRDHSFVGTVINKVVFEKKIVANSNLPIIYAAVGRGSSPAADNMAGLWRSVNGGRSWVQLAQGEATDFAIGEGSARPNTNNRPTIGYLAIAGAGVRVTTNLNLASGVTFVDTTAGVGRPTVQSGLLTVSSNGTPNGAKGRIQLVTPKYISNDPLANNYYQQWLVAAVTAADGRFDGLYVTKDRGLNWTRLNLNTSGVNGGNATTGGDLETLNVDPAVVTPLNDWFTSFGADHSLSLAMDPQDPNILYVGSDRLIRVDMTFTDDPYRFQLYSHRDATGGIYTSTTDANNDTSNGGGGLISVNPNTGLGSRTPIDDSYDFALSSTTRRLWNFTNLKFDPYQPFLSDATLSVTRDINGNGVTSFENNGNNTPWIRPIVARDPNFGPVPVFGSDFDYVSSIITTVDPLTGRTRVVWGHDEGIGTFVTQGGDGSLNRIDGFNQANQNLTDDTNLQVEGSRNGDIQIGRLYSGDSQPSLLAASIGQSLLLAAGRRGGDVQVSNQGQLGNGNNSFGSDGRPSSTNYVVADPTGSGTVYSLRRIGEITGGVVGDFFQVQLQGGLPISRTNGLLRSSADAQGGGQWDASVRRFTVNPIDGNGIAIGSNNGTLFATVDQGLNWDIVGTSSDFQTNTNLPAIAYGAPVITAPGDPAAGLNDYKYVGTDEGRIYVKTGNALAANWTNITNGDLTLDGSAVEKIVPSPVRGSNALYAVTRTGVFYMANWAAKTTDANGATIPDPVLSVWKNITGTGNANLFRITNSAFSLGTNYTSPILRQLSSIAVDWRPLFSSTPGTPILFAAGDGGVFRSTDNGTTWARYGAGSGFAGGGMPVVKVSDIDLALGNVVQGTGRTDSTGSPDMLVATTLGRGMWTLALGKPAGVTGPKIVPAKVTPLNPVSGSLSSVTVEFDGFISATTFTAADVTIKAPNGTLIPATGVTDITTPLPSGVNLHNKFRIDFAGQAVQGTYTITVGPNITDGGGTPMNQNGNAINGETSTATKPGDSYTFQVVIAGTDIADFIRDSYVKLFNRQPTTAEYLARATAIETPRFTGLGTVVRQLLTGYDPTTKTYDGVQEARTQLVTRLFTNGGATDEVGNLLPAHVFGSGEVASLVAQLNAGTKTPETLMVDIIAGNEYFTVAGGTADGFLNKLYKDLYPGQFTGLDGSGVPQPVLPVATLDARTLAAQRTQAGTAAGRKALATSLLNGATVKYDNDGVGFGSVAITTMNYRANTIRLAYNKYLGRTPTTAELSAGATAMTRFGRNLPGGSENLNATIFATREYFNAKFQNEPAAPNGLPADNTQRTNRSWVEAVISDRYFRTTTDANGNKSTNAERNTFSQKILDTYATARTTFARGLTSSAEYRAIQIAAQYKLVHGSTRNLTEAELSSQQSFLTRGGTLPGIIAARLASAEFSGLISPPAGQQTMYTITGIDPGTVTGTPAQIAVTNSVIWARAVYSVLFGTLLTDSNPAITFLASFSRTNGRNAAALNVLNAVDGASAALASKFKPVQGVLGGTYREIVITGYFQSTLGRNPVGPFTTPTTEAGKYLTYLKTNRWEFLQADLLIGREFYEVIG